MSVEEMKIMGIIGPKTLLNRVLRVIILHGSMHMINAFTRINSADFFLPPTERNIEALEEEPFLTAYSDKRDFSAEEKIVKALNDLFEIKPGLNEEFLEEEYDYDLFKKQFLKIYDILHSTEQKIEAKLQEIEVKKELIKNVKYLSRINLDISHLTNMKYLVFRLIKITRENYDKLKRNYENIPAVILKVAVEGKYVILVSITPETLEETLEKIFSSLNYTILPIPKDIKGTAEEISEQITHSITEDQQFIESLKKSIEEYKEKYKDELKKVFSRLEMEKKVEELKSEIAIGSKLFFMFGFVPDGNINKLKTDLEKRFGDKLIILIDEVKKPNSGGILPPTKLKNIWLFKPFESLIKMYGIPSYQEEDPTIFFSLTYMIIFGAMFGDVGQGLILLISGLILKYIYQKIDFGGILNRLGLSSIIFGFLYGSVFGSEEILPALIIRPMANIENILITSVILGIILISLGYIFNIINAKKQNNIQGGLLGQNGLVGFIFYLLLLYSIYQVFIKQKKLFPGITIILVLLLLIILFKEPLAQRLFHSGYTSPKLSANNYIEEGFGIIEMLLSMLSNTISFVRVGAFALNHVGLYIAFLTLANMMNSVWGNWAVIIVGNVVILTLEALIVFIQALRLEYYELFTKYFRGDGIEYIPAKINNVSSQKEKKRLFLKMVISFIKEKVFYNFIKQKKGYKGDVYHIIYCNGYFRADYSWGILSNIKKT